MKHVSIPKNNICEFINIVPVNPLISKCQIKVCYVSDQPNRNRSIITKETATKMAQSLPGCPIVGFYNKEKEDFEGHKSEMVVNEETGVIEFHSLTVPYGFVDMNPKVWFQTFIDDNKVEREYLMTEGYIWTGQYPEAQRIIDEGNNQSMELDKNSLKGHWTNSDKDKVSFLIINEAIISKLCILGEEVEPCFEGAQIGQFALEENVLAKFMEMAYELKEITEKGGTTSMDENTIVIEEGAPAIEEPIVEENNFEENGQESSIVNEENSENSEGNDTTVEGNAEEAYSLDNIPEYQELLGNYQALQTEYDNLSAGIADKDRLIEELSAFKAEVEKGRKQEMINSFCMLSDEDKKEVQDNIDKYSVEEIEAKLAVICVRNKVSFNLEEETSDKDNTTTFSLNEEVDDAPAWIKAVRANSK